MIVLSNPINLTVSTLLQTQPEKKPFPAAQESAVYEDVSLVFNRKSVISQGPGPTGRQRCLNIAFEKQTNIVTL